MSASSAASFESRSGAKPPSSPTAVERPWSCSVFFSAWKTSAPMRSALGEARRADRHDHELLEVDLVVGVRAAVQHVHHRHGQHVRRLAAEVAPQRLPGLGRGRLRGRERHAEDRVGAEAALVRRAVEVDHRAVERLLVGGVDAAAPPRRSRRSRSRPPSTRPCRPSASPPSRSSTASNSPVEAPEGTAARPAAPDFSSTSTSTVGLPRRVEDLARVDLARSRSLCLHLSSVLVGRAAQGELGVLARVHAPRFTAASRRSSEGRRWRSDRPGVGRRA